MNQRHDIVVAGGGLTGAAAACLFARAGFTVALADARGDGDDGDGNGDGDDGRVSAIGLASVNLLRALQVWPVAGAYAYKKMQVWDANSNAKIFFCSDDIGVDQLGYIVDNAAAVAAMRDKLRANYRTTLLDDAVDGVEHDGDGVRVTVGGVTVGAKLLLGADGANSKVRACAGIKTRTDDFAQDAVVAAVSVGDHQHTALQCFLSTGPAALLPLADRRCSLVWSAAREVAGELVALDDDEFCARLEKVFGDAVGTIAAVGDRKRFPLAQHHAQTYLAERVALIGDAAHTTHPLAGLGANLGLVDAAALAEAVAGARDRGRDIGARATLRRYERRRRGDNAVVLTAMAGFHRLFTASHPAAVAARAAGVNLADAVAPLKNFFARHATGVAGDLPAVCRPSAA